MQKRAGLLYLSKKTKRILLILENSKWTVPTFFRNDGLIKDAGELFGDYSDGKIIPIELYLSHDKGFEYGTYICLVEKEFIQKNSLTFSWADLDNLPNNLHSGLKATLNNQIIKTKINTIMELEDANIK
jgi:hypothetical protein